MSKNIIFCADGSWSHPNEVQDGSFAYKDKQKCMPGELPIDVAGTTNVFKFYDALKTSADQVAFYDSGVGTRGDPFKRIVEGALGEGLFDKVKDGYDDIAKTYEDGDVIHMFGFSRGAYTVCSLAGMISTCGLPAHDKYSPEALEACFAAYRERNPARKGKMIQHLVETYGNRPVKIDGIGAPSDVRIAEVGVWDTVGSMGLPGRLFKKGDEYRYGFLDTNLPAGVEAAWHALAIDEHRSEFAPTPFSKPYAPWQQVDEVWFAGSHGDVGGGTADPALSDIPLGWMMKKAQSKGLVFDEKKLAKYTNLPQDRAFNQIHDSWKDSWGEKYFRPIPEDAKIASSVVVRMREDPTYRPPKLQVNAQDRAQYNLIPGSMQIEEVLAPKRLLGVARG